MAGRRHVSVPIRALWVALALLVTPSFVHGQTVVDAGIAEFVPSADHHQVVSGQAVVTSYQMQVVAAATAQLVRTVELGKPAPQGNGLIRINFLSLLTTPLAGGVEYRARVAAVGPGGSTASALSNTFSYSVPCAPTVSPASATLPAPGGGASASVSVASGCAWTATSGASWLTVTAGAAGNGSGSMSFTATENTSTSPRTGTVTVAGRTVSVTQAGAACVFAVSPQAITAPAAGATGTLAVTTSASCSWTVTGLPAWMSVSRASGTGGGTLTYTVAPNGNQSRSAGIVVAGRTITVSQRATLAAPRNLRIVLKQPKQ